MRTNKILFWIALVCILIAAGIYSYAYWQMKITRENTGSSTELPLGKVAASTVEDGTYTVQIRSTITSPEDKTITFKHVTYFEGDEAEPSAKEDVMCEKQPIEACVPTLAHGYYVRPSGAPDFTAPVTTSTKIVLKDKEVATFSDLEKTTRNYEPVFDVEIVDGNITSITEKSPI